MPFAQLLRRPVPSWALIGPVTAGLLIAVIAWTPALSKLLSGNGPDIDVDWQLVAFILLVTVGSAAAALALHLHQTSQPSVGSAASSLSLPALQQAGSRLELEASKIAAIIASSADSHESYAESLGSLQDQIAAVQTPEQLRAVATLLAAENHRMRIDTKTMATELEASRTQVQALRSDLERAQEEGLRDALTGLNNRRAYDMALEEAIRTASAGDTPLAVVMIDIDSFKSINDAHGHQAGDAVLRAFAGCLLDGVGIQGTVARFGGEEFAIILPNMTSMAAAVLAERMRDRIQSYAFETGQSERLHITASLGVAQRRDDEGASSLLRRADERLYRAKNLGRNRVVTV